jgi:hypothetical protein
MGRLMWWYSGSAYIEQDATRWESTRRKPRHTAAGSCTEIDKYNEYEGDLWVGDSWVRWDEDQDWTLREKDCERCGHFADNVDY